MIRLPDGIVVAVIGDDRAAYLVREALLLHGEAVHLYRPDTAPVVAPVEVRTIHGELFVLEPLPAPVYAFDARRRRTKGDRHRDRAGRWS